MARADALRQVLAQRERQDAARLRDAAALDHDRAVVQRRLGQEDRDEQVALHRRVDRGAGFDQIREMRLALQHEERAHPLLRERLRRARHFLGELRLLLLRDGREHAAPDARQRTPDVGLEEHDDDQHRGGEEVVEDPLDGGQLEGVRHEAGADQQQQADEDLHGARAADQDQQPVDAERDERDVDGVAHRVETGDLIEQQAPEHLDQARAPRSAAATCAARTPAPTSCTRIAFAPAKTATAQAAALATSRCIDGIAR